MQSRVGLIRERSIRARAAIGAVIPLVGQSWSAASHAGESHALGRLIVGDGLRLNGHDRNRGHDRAANGKDAGGLVYACPGWSGKRNRSNRLIEA